MRKALAAHAARLGGLMRRPRRILVLGVPRAGTSWIGSTLSQGPGRVYVNEPDSVGVGPGAEAGVEGFGQRPILAPGQAPPVNYEQMWADAFGVGARGALVVKSVKAHGTIDWIAERFAPDVVIVQAHPLNVVSSWVGMGWTGGPMSESWFGRARPELLTAVGGWPERPIEQIALRVGALFQMQDDALSRHPEWTVATHETLCADPTAGFEELHRRLGLPFDQETRAFVAATDAPGSGYDITRKASAAPLRWRRLEADDLAAAQAILERLGLEVAALPQ